MKNIVLSAMILTAGVLISANGARAEGLKEGKWSITMTTKVEGKIGRASCRERVYVLV